MVSVFVYFFNKKEISYINTKSHKSGFTLIELLVVIGILAVLVAIAISLVAGLIDKANVSADNSKNLNIFYLFFL